MTKKEFLKQYKGKAIWCKTEDLANEFLKLADNTIKGLEKNLENAKKRTNKKGGWG